MAVTRSPGVFRYITLLGSPNCTDTNSATGGTWAAWSQGATLLDQIQLPFKANAPWSLLGFSVTASIQFVRDSPALDPPYGRLGKIWTGLQLDAPGQTHGPSPSEPWQNPVLPLPTDTTTIAPLFDPTTDEMPPTISSSLPQTAALQQAVTVILPEPVTLSDYTNACMGIWILPSLTNQGNGLIVTNGRYLLIYDEPT